MTLDALLVDERAVGAAEIFDNELGVVAQNPRVVARHGRVEHLHFVGAPATQRKRQILQRHPGHVAVRIAEHQVRLGGRVLGHRGSQRFVEAGESQRRRAFLGRLTPEGD